MRTAFDFFDEILTPFSGAQRWDTRMKFNPPCDVEESDLHYLVSFDLPGVSKEDLKIEVLENQLLVSGQRRSEKRESGTRHLVERQYGEFQRIFNLPASVDSEKVEANFSDGVLRIAIPKAEVARPKQIRIGEEKSGLFGRLLGKESKGSGEAA